MKIMASRWNVCIVSTSKMAAKQQVSVGKIRRRKLYDMIAK